MKSQSASQPPPPPPAPKEHSHVLSKKPSSFFRRRKKSVSENEVPVPVPVVPLPSVKPEVADEKPLPSPVSSLRKVMIPYLKTPLRTPMDPYPQNSIDQRLDDSDEVNSRNVRGFSPDYEPDKSATIRTVQSSREEPMDDLTSQVAEGPFPTNPDSGPSGGEGNYVEPDVTFLQDNSDNDREAPDDSLNIGLEQKEILGGTFLGTARAPSLVVARDMALVAEYERVYSKRSPTPAKSETARSSPVVAAQKSPMESKSSLKQSALNTKDEEWVMLTPSKSPKEVESEPRVWLEPSSSEEDLGGSSPALPLKPTEIASGMSESTDTIYESATSLPVLQIDGEEESEHTEHLLLTANEAIRSLDELDQVEDNLTPAEGDRERAQKVYDGNEDFIQREKAAAWMGEEGPVRSRTLMAYMELYDFTNLNILAALRVMCGRLVLKAESQQVDGANVTPTTDSKPLVWRPPLHFGTS
jgi:hypothetical protein